MNCPKCGNEVAPDAKFCAHCGTPLTGISQPEQAAQSSEQTAADQPATEQTAAEQAAAQSAAESQAPAEQAAAQPAAESQAPAEQAAAPAASAEQPTAAAAPAEQAAAAPVVQPAPTYQQPNYQAAPAAQPAPTYQQPSYQAVKEPTCFGEAWRDITSSAGWLKRVLLLMLMKCIPILGFYVSGYCLQWGADAARGTNSPIPKGTFGKGTILAGIFYWILGIIVTLASIWFYILGSIPFVGWIITLVAVIMLDAFLALMGMRMMMFEAFGQSFELSAIFKAYRHKTWNLIVAAELPRIIMIAIFAVIALIVGLIAGMAVLFGGASFIDAAYAYSTTGNTDVFGMVIALLAAFGVAIFILLFVYLFLSGFAEVWSLRSVGHWVNRYAPEWIEESKNSKGSLSEQV